jgi:hypothetical protein
MPRALRLEYPGAMYHVLILAGGRFRPVGENGRAEDRHRPPRAETAVTLKWIPPGPHMGAWMNVSNLPAQPVEPSNQTQLNWCQK